MGIPYALTALSLRKALTISSFCSGLRPARTFCGVMPSFEAMRLALASLSPVSIMTLHADDDFLVVVVLVIVVGVFVGRLVQDPCVVYVGFV